MVDDSIHKAMETVRERVRFGVCDQRLAVGSDGSSRATAGLLQEGLSSGKLGDNSIYLCQPQLDLP
jgi:hypothetical protein